MWRVNKFVKNRHVNKLPISYCHCCVAWTNLVLGKSPCLLNVTSVFTVMQPFHLITTMMTRQWSYFIRFHKAPREPQKKLHNRPLFANSVISPH